MDFNLMARTRSGPDIWVRKSIMRDKSPTLQKSGPFNIVLADRFYIHRGIKSRSICTTKELDPLPVHFFFFFF